MKRNSLFQLLSDKFLEREIKAADVNIVSVSLEQQDFHSIKLVNDTFTATFGYENGVGQNLNIILPDIIKGQHARFIETYIATNKE